ncbi:GNAT family N-acetyltransferase [Actinokineospora bangkokensis]|uniref:GNAT family N-acetyltransferase n=1 Tax=Actinokineospora bangkokensis TaxID=1193682 RepID=UPI000B26FDE9|nr:GNAT family N-acetyltransferase [Actinokineospora bangkokensis]
MVVIRRGGAADAAAVRRLMAVAVRWLAERGRSAQWGSEVTPEREEQVTTFVRDHEAWVAEVDGAVAGVLTLTPESPDYVPGATEPELYVRLLLTDREHKGRGIGAALLERAVERAREEGVGVVRVDCFAGLDDRLVDFYRGCGFVEQGRFERRGWRGCVLARRVEP